MRTRCEKIISIEDKMRENRLRWFGDVHYRPIDAPVRMSDKIVFKGDATTRGRTKDTWIEVLKKDVHVTEEMTLNGAKWKKRI